MPENIEALFQSDEIINAEQNLSTVIQELKGALTLKSQSKTALKKLKNQAEKAMDCYINELFKKVNDIRKATTFCLDTLFFTLDTSFNEEIDKLELSLSTADTVLKDTKKSRFDKSNKSEQFVCGKIADTTANKCIKLYKQLKSPKIDSITFTPHALSDELLKPLLKRNTLGTFGVVRAKTSENSDPYTVQRERLINVHDSCDKNTCYISGSCSFPDGTILLIDSNNCRLKRLLPHQSTVSDNLDLPTVPWSVCATSEQEAAVTLPHTQKVQFLSIGKTVEKTETMKLDYLCYGIAYHGGELYVSDNEITVYVYTAAGKLLRQFSMDKIGDKLFSYIYNMAVSESGHALYVADWNIGLIAVDTQDGHKVWQYTADDLKSARGVCVDHRSNIFVCGYNSNNVLQISESGEKIAEILTQADGISCPRSICFRRNTCELALNSSNESHLFTLNC